MLLYERFRQSGYLNFPEPIINVYGMGNRAGLGAQAYFAKGVDYNPQLGPRISGFMGLTVASIRGHWVALVEEAGPVVPMEARGAQPSGGPTLLVLVPRRNNARGTCKPCPAHNHHEVPVGRRL